MPAEKQQNKQSTPRTNWHALFETVNLTALTDVGLKVDPEYRLMSESPVVDILLQRRDAQWTAAQLTRLPDGVRHSKALYILIDLKKTESLNEKMLLKTLAYDIYFKRESVSTINYISCKTKIISDGNGLHQLAALQIPFHQLTFSIEARISVLSATRNDL